MTVSVEISDSHDWTCVILVCLAVEVARLSVDV